MIPRSIAPVKFLFVLCLAAAGLHAAAQNTILVNRIGPSSGMLYIANSDGSSERLLASGGNFEYDASYSADGQWIVFTSERNGPANIYRIHPDGSALDRPTARLIAELLVWIAQTPDRSGLPSCGCREIGFSTGRPRNPGCGVAQPLRGERYRSRKQNN